MMAFKFAEEDGLFDGDLISSHHSRVARRRTSADGSAEDCRRLPSDNAREAFFKSQQSRISVWRMPCWQQSNIPVGMDHDAPMLPSIHPAIHPSSSFFVVRQWPKVDLPSGDFGQIDTTYITAAAAGELDHRPAEFSRGLAFGTDRGIRVPAARSVGR